eukprot:547471-Pleurochrysis_carterae.AAC.1
MPARGFGQSRHAARRDWRELLHERVRASPWPLAQRRAARVSAACRSSRPCAARSCRSSCPCGES